MGLYIWLFSKNVHLKWKKKKKTKKQGVFCPPTTGAVMSSSQCGTIGSVLTIVFRVYRKNTSKTKTKGVVWIDVRGVNRPTTVKEQLPWVMWDHPGLSEAVLVSRSHRRSGRYKTNGSGWWVQQAHLYVWRRHVLWVFSAGSDGWPPTWSSDHLQVWFISVYRLSADHSCFINCLTSKWRHI